MRWKDKTFDATPRPDDPERLGEVRYLHKFLFWPLRIGDETRWLERACIKQEGVKEWISFYFIPFQYPTGRLIWENKEFA